MPHEPTLLLTTMGLRDHFRDQVSSALHRQHVEVADGTAGYLVDLLIRYAHPEHLFNESPDGRQLRALAEIYADAVHAEGTEQRNHALKTLGDFALFIAGVFSGYLNRRLVDVDYYIAMGCGAYRDLRDFVRHRLSREGALVFDELSRKFPQLVDVLADVSEESHLGARSDLLRQYELWLRTRSPRALRKLQQHGIHPTPQATVHVSH
ncbi:MAG: hypothetical protein IT493_07925 [Gammaproteobacteria bacterium]|nr:hypothetical protein [Gammaproteobacteria bacterium]